ncbi:MAG: polysaccharide pyruvyl transferase family protein [Ectothiorhodospiraceae bacterium]|nr:polysaccharide pyruvyl transferase family protein [Ectothiorhodospiraceae bacterium]
MKRVGLVGFFGWGNFGDELFVEVYRQHLGDAFSLAIPHDLLKKPYFSRPIADVVRDYDAFLIGGGDLIIPWNLSGLYWREEYLSKPVYVVGVGVPTWGGYDKKTILAMRSFLQHDNVQMVCARDPESQKWIAKHLQPRCEVIWAPDLVCAMALAPATTAVPPRLGVVTRHRRGGADDYSQLRRLCEKAAAEGYVIRHIVLANGATGEKDRETAAEFEFEGKETVYTESLDEMCVSIGECTAITSMKFHGTVVATMYGVPSIVLSPTDKSRNFMRMIERTDLLSNLKDQHLADHFATDLPPIAESTRASLRAQATAMLRDLKSRLAAV